MSDSNLVMRGPSLFRFEFERLKAVRFKEILYIWWNGLQVVGSTSFGIQSKIKSLQQIIKLWDKQDFDKTEDRKLNALSKGVE